MSKKSKVKSNEKVIEVTDVSKDNLGLWDIDLSQSPFEFLAENVPFDEFKYFSQLIITTHSEYAKFNREFIKFIITLCSWIIWISIPILANIQNNDFINYQVYFIWLILFAISILLWMIYLTFLTNIERKILKNFYEFIWDTMKTKDLNLLIMKIQVFVSEKDKMVKKINEFLWIKQARINSYVYYWILISFFAWLVWLILSFFLK